MTSPAHFAERITEAVTPLIDEAQYYLESVNVRNAGRRLLVQIVVDSDGRLDLDEVASISRRLDILIEEQDLLDDIGYTLEVTSPGIDRPLTLPRHWRANVGRKVQVVMNDESVFIARVASATDDEVSFEDHSPVRLGDISQGQVQIEFNRPKSAAAEEPADFDDQDEYDDETLEDEA